MLPALFPDSGSFFPRLRIFSSRSPVIVFRKSETADGAHLGPPQASAVTPPQVKAMIMKGSWRYHATNPSQLENSS